MTDHKTANQSGFADLGISGTLLKATTDAGFLSPKPIQAQAIPAMLAGGDVLGIAQTGSGKTAAFSLPILAQIMALGTKRVRKSARALILCPTRELAVQIDEVIRKLGRHAHLSTALVLGGMSRGTQVRRLAQGVDVLIATPGRLTDIVRSGELSLAETRWLVLDEADRMLDMGFINDVRRIARATHPERQTALFSATMPREIEQLAASLLKEPQRVEIAKESTTAGEITQSLVMARTKQKRKVLSDMLADEGMRSVIVFARTKHGADRVTRDLERDGFDAAVIHGNKSQNARQRALNGFRDGRVRILVATDIAARGIDVPGITHVVNFDLPDQPESYVHRIGRTGRNGASGEAVTLCDPGERDKLRAVERTIRTRLSVAADHTSEPDPARPARQPSEPRAAAPAQPHSRQGNGNANGHGNGNGNGNGGRGPQKKRPPRKAAGEGRPASEKPFRRRRRPRGKRPAAQAA